MPPVMSDAYEDSLELDAAIEKELKDSSKLPTDEPFLGSNTKDVPKEVEEAKTELEEDFSNINETLDESERREVIGTMTLDKENPDWVNYAESPKYDEVVKALPSTVPVYIYPQGSSLGHSAYWSFDAVDSEGNKTKARTDTYLYELGRYLDGTRGMTLKLDPNWSFTGKYPYLVKTNESLTEDEDSVDWWNSLGKEEKEEIDLWTLVYDTLNKNRDLSADNATKKYDTPRLSSKQRYDNLHVDTDGNIIIFDETEDDLQVAKDVADYHNLKYIIKDTGTYGVMHPDKAYSITIIIPEDRYDDVKLRKNK